MEEVTSFADDGIEEIIIDFGDICRFCLMETKEIITINDKCFTDQSGNSSEETINEFVSKMTSVEMDSPDCFPVLVCSSCLELIKVCYNFSVNCLQSDLSLRECYVKTLDEAKAKCSALSPENERSKIEEIISDQVDDVTLKEEDMDVSQSALDTSSDDACQNISSGEAQVTLVESIKDEKEEPSDKEFKTNDYYSLFSAGNVKKKFKKITTLSERLEEAQSKLAEDIRRSENIMLKKRDAETQKFEEETAEDIEFSSYHCAECPVSYKLETSLNTHIKTIHKKESKPFLALKSAIFECRVCPKTFNRKWLLVQHNHLMHKTDSKNSQEVDLLPQIKSENTFKKRYKCTKCVNNPKSFDRREKILRHLTAVHKITNDNMREAALREISESANVEKCYACTRCKSQPTFASRFSLNRHLMNLHKLGRQDITQADGKLVEVTRDEPKSVEEFLKIKGEEKTEDLKLFKLYICTDCSPPLSFSVVTLFIKHKQEAHNRKIEEIPLHELSPVYVDTPDMFKKGDVRKKSSVVKVICKNCDPPTEYDTTSDFVKHMQQNHRDSQTDNWEIDSRVFFENVSELCDEKSMDESKDRKSPWQCTDCDACYIRKHSLNTHMKEKHNKILKIGAIECPELDCPETFYTNKQVIQHGITVHNKYFADLHNIFKKKILADTPEGDYQVKKFKCDICQSHYVRKTSLKRHILKAHLGAAKKEAAVCPYCGKTLTNKLNLKSHIEFVHEAVFVSCPVCKKKVNFKTIGRHYKSHQNTSVEANITLKNKYLCNQCGRVLKSKAGFADHLKIHTNIRDHVCDICNSGFTTKKNLQIHKKVHEGAMRKTFECEQCDKTFFGKHTLNRHLLTHSGKKNFICEMCSKNFYTIQELNRHVRYHKKDYRFDCSLCEMRFMDKSRFRHHMMRHRNIRPHKCNFCDKVFIVRRKMNLHMAARHNVQVRSTRAVWKDPKTYVPLDDLL